MGGGYFKGVNRIGTGRSPRIWARVKAKVASLRDSSTEYECPGLLTDRRRDSQLLLQLQSRETVYPYSATGLFHENLTTS